MDARSDIYSFGATLYHLLTGEKPTIATGEIKPLASFGIQLSEGIVYIVEKCMERDPANRFQSALLLEKAITEIHKLDKRWKRQNTQKNIAAVVLAGMFALSSLTAMLGWRHMGEEKVARYNGLVDTISAAADMSAFSEAIAIFPEKIDAYRAFALARFNAGEYSECISFVQSTLGQITAYAQDVESLRQVGDLYYIQGNCYFALEDYQNATAAYDAAIRDNPENTEYYLDYAIALTRGGNADRASQVLGIIENVQTGDVYTNLLRGEIAFANQEFSEAIDFFRRTINTTTDDYIKQRAYLICARAYRQSGDITGEIVLLREAAGALPVSYQAVITEQLAGALVRAGQAGQAEYDGQIYYKEAVAIYEDLLKRGNTTYGVRQNIALLYQELGDYNAAGAALRAMREEYPERYQIPMRLAYLVLEEQASKPNAERDYADAAQLYQTAQELYANRPPNAGDDIEMVVLGSLIDELDQNGWLE
jgi:serine/threonine-protein kinase